MAIAGANVSPSGHKQSWADLSDDEEDFGHSDSSDAKCNVGATSVTTGTGSPLMSWANASDDGELSDWEAKNYTEEDAAFQAARNSESYSQAYKSQWREWNNSGQWWQQPQGQRRQQRKGGTNGTNRRTPPPLQSPHQQRHQRQQGSPAGLQNSPQRHFGAADMTWSQPGSQFNPLPASSLVQPFSVQVEGMPAQLCNDCCLDAILHQAGLQDFALDYQIHQGASGGVATIKLTNWQAAMQCYNHFSKQSWNLGRTVKVKMAPNSQQTPLQQQEQQQLQQHETCHQQHHGAQHHLAMNGGFVFDAQATWTPQLYTGEACDFAAGPYYMQRQPNHQMLHAGMQMQAHA